MVAAADPAMEEVTSLAEEAEGVVLAADAVILEAAGISIGVITVAAAADAILEMVEEAEAILTIRIIVEAATAAIIMDTETAEVSMIITAVATVQLMRQMVITAAMQCAARQIWPDPVQDEAMVPPEIITEEGVAVT